MTSSQPQVYVWYVTHFPTDFSQIIKEPVYTFQGRTHYPISFSICYPTLFYILQSANSVVTKLGVFTFSYSLTYF